MNTRKRFEKFIHHEPNTGCWLFSSVGVREYGGFWLNGRCRPAHRVAYELYIGPIPEGMCVCHSCDVPACVNPDHLWLGTQADNVLDRDTKRRRVAPKGSETSFAKLTEEQVEQILLDDRIQREIAADYGVSREAISSIKTKRNWKHLND